MILENIALPVGVIKGRTALDMKTIKIVSESSLEICLSVDNRKCSMPLNENIRYFDLKVIIDKMLFFKMQNNEFLPNLHTNSCLSEILDSELVRENSEIQSNLRHIVITTYDSIFEIICSSIKFEIIPLSYTDMVDH